MSGVVDRHDFIIANTRLMPVPLVPEIALHIAHEALPLWQKTEEELGEMGLPPPFWAFAWAGGQALARYILDNPEIVCGKKVLDLASGSGLVGIAAMKAGAVRVMAADIDGFALQAVRVNAAANGVDVTACGEDLLDIPPPDVDVVLVGDLFYERSVADRLAVWLESAVRQETDVLIGDPGRSYLPRDRLVSCASYEVPVTRDLEDAEIKNSQVWRLA
ncbi:MAG: class I SAM-dependent methyltransferase [Anderseniella sp.]